VPPGDRHSASGGCAPQEHVLVTSGIYSVLRHPAYFGFFWWWARPARPPEWTSIA